jgi:SAM-dependent methyltransferase
MVAQFRMANRRARARELAAQYLARGDSTGWFEQLYREAAKDSSSIPWADLRPNPNLIEFWRQHRLSTAAKSALKIGCGLGDDAEQLASWGFRTTAFDISASAIEACRRRFPNSAVSYTVADLLRPPDDWIGGFDFVLESYTLQVLPPYVRVEAMRRIADLVSPGGLLLLITRGRDERDSEGRMPWPLTRQELDHVTRCGLRELSFEDYCDEESPPVRRFRVLYEKQTHSMRSHSS